uniref:Uncharacterized protein n=1 Tax=Anguilla anguilla TaxID=7936 RepID=A0A0E9PSH0_ANGAN
MFFIWRPTWGSVYPIPNLNIYHF